MERSTMEKLIELVEQMKVQITGLQAEVAQLREEVKASRQPDKAVNIINPTGTVQMNCPSPTTSTNSTAPKASPPTRPVTRSRLPVPERSAAAIRKKRSEFRFFCKCRAGFPTSWQRDRHIVSAHGKHEAIDVV